MNMQLELSFLKISIFSNIFIDSQFNNQTISTLWMVLLCTKKYKIRQYEHKAE